MSCCTPNKEGKIDNVAYALDGPKAAFKLWKYTLRQPEADEVILKVLYCGICHSDIHTGRGEWQKTEYPFVPGHEFVGKICAMGAAVKDRKIDQLVGVGCFVRSCTKCKHCHNNTEQFCSEKVGTYDAKYKGEPTYGGYGAHVVLQSRCAVPIPEGMDVTRVAPLLCAGITTFSPINQCNMKRGNLRIAVNGLGGLGHMAVQFAHAVNSSNEVYVFSRNYNKEKEAKQLGAKGVIVLDEKQTSGEFSMKDFMGTFNYIIDTVSSNDKCFDQLVSMLYPHGEIIVLGMPPMTGPAQVTMAGLLMQNKVIRGSTIGGIKELTEMLQFSSDHKIYPMCEHINGDQLDKAYERVIKGDVKFRFVINVADTYK